MSSTSSGFCRPTASATTTPTRTGLDPLLRTRELLTLAMLIAVITQLLPFVGYPRTLNALRALDEVVPAG